MVLPPVHLPGEAPFATGGRRLHAMMIAIVDGVLLEGIVEFNAPGLIPSQLQFLSFFALVRRVERN
jgi:hypothetical protein